MNLMLAIRTRKAFPEDEVVYVGRYTDQEGDSAFKQVLEFGKRVGKAGQVILELVHEREGSVSELQTYLVYGKVLSPMSTHHGRDAYSRHWKSS